MAALGNQSIASSYEQLLHVDRDGGGNETTLVDVKDGDNGTTFALKLATDKIQVNGSATFSSATSTVITAENTGNTAVTLNLDADRSGADQGLGNINFKWNGTAVAQISGASGADTTNKDDGQIQFSTMSGGSSSVNMTLDKDGKLGIGSSPSTKLHVYEATDNAFMTLESADAGEAIFNMKANTNRTNQIKFFEAGTESAKMLYNHNGDKYEFYAGGVASGNVRMVIDANSRISLSNNDGGTSNTVFGSIAGDDLASGGNYNSFFGHNSGHAVTTGDYNTAFGLNALDGSTVPDRCTALGTASLRGALTTDAIGSVAVGYASLSNLTSGAANTAVGYETLTSNTTGIYNTALGFQSLRTNIDGDHNTALGYASLYSFEAGSDGQGHNTAIGSNASLLLDSGQYNTMVGSSAGQSSVGTITYDGNTGIGYKSLFALTTGDYNSVVGYEAADALTTGQENVVMGRNAMGAATTTNSCVLLGVNAGSSINNNDDNGTVAVGINSLSALTEGQYNTAVGTNAGENITTGDGNTAIGYQAMDANTTGNQNTAVGYGAAGAIPGGALGNTAIGYNALANGNNDATDENTCIGHLAGDLITSGENNVIIGAGADVGTNTDSNSIVIGREAIGQGTNTVVLGNSAHTDIYMAQDKGANVNAVGITGWRGNSQWVRRTHEKTTGADTDFNTFATITPGGSNQYSYSEIVVTTTSRTNTSGETGFKTSRWYMKMDNGTMTVAQVGSDIDSGTPADFQIAVSSNVAQLQVASPAANTSWISIFVEAKLHSGFSAGNTWTYADV